MAAPKRPQGVSPIDQAGLTLIELMIGVLLASVFISGLFYLFSGQKKTYTQQHNQMTNHQSLAGAMQFLTRQIRRGGTGFGGCPNSQAKMWSGSGTDTKVSPYVALQVYNGCDLTTTAPASCSGNDGVDSFTIAYSDDAAVGTLPAARLIADALTSDSASPIRVRTAGNFQAGDRMILWDPRREWCTMLAVTGNPTSGGGGFELPHAAGGSVDSVVYNPTGGLNIFPSSGYGVGALVVRIGPRSRVRHFSIDSSTNPPRLVTWTTEAANPSANKGDLEVLADGVEDMQIAWACDVDGDGDLSETPSSPTTDEWAFADPGDTAPTCGDARISAVRITLIARQPSPDMENQTSYRPAAEDRAAGSPAADQVATNGMGTFVRSTLTTVVNLPNVAGLKQ
ncbi:MAG: PilW family protein [Deltaproteobacteria bacterium]|nr:PilW family protein [Deltaproteobacteria bacterium]